MKYKQFVLRVPISLYVELTVVEPGIVNANGETRYGGLSEFFNNLLLQHLAKRREAIRGAAVPVPVDTSV